MKLKSTNQVQQGIDYLGITNSAIFTTIIAHFKIISEFYWTYFAALLGEGARFSEMLKSFAAYCEWKGRAAGDKIEQAIRVIYTHDI